MVRLTAELLSKEHGAGADVVVDAVHGNYERGADWDGGLFDIAVNKTFSPRSITGILHHIGL